MLHTVSYERAVVNNQQLQLLNLAVFSFIKNKHDKVFYWHLPNVGGGEREIFVCENSLKMLSLASLEGDVYQRFLLLERGYHISGGRS